MAEGDTGDLAVKQECVSVIPLIQGFARPANSGNTEYACCGSVTLVKSENNLILVDTAGPPNKDELIQGLASANVSCADITHVVCTHGHLDHIGNLNLFPTAQFFLDSDIGSSSFYTGHDYTKGPYHIGKNVDVISSPGHTSHDLSVVVRQSHIAHILTQDSVSTDKCCTIVIAGDIFEREDDSDIWQANSHCVERQIASRQRITTLADVIVPGHGPLFRVVNN